MPAKKKKPDLSDWVALTINLFYTYHIVIADTEHGTDAQRDFVAFFTAAMMLLSMFLAVTLTDEHVLRAKRRPRAFGELGRVLLVIQLLLFAGYAHFWLLLMRVIGVAVMWSRYRLADARTKETKDSERVS